MPKGLAGYGRREEEAALVARPMYNDDGSLTVTDVGLKREVSWEKGRVNSEGKGVGRLVTDRKARKKMQKERLKAEWMLGAGLGGGRSARGACPTGSSSGRG